MATTRNRGRRSDRTLFLQLGGSAGAVLMAWALGILEAGGSVAFALAATAAVVALARTGAALARGTNPLREARRALLPVLVVGVVVAFDPGASDPFSMPKASLLVVGSTVIAVLWALECLLAGLRPRWRTSLRGPVVVLLFWTALATATGISPRFSVLGAYSSYDGLAVALCLGLIFFAVLDAYDVEDLGRLIGVLWFAAGGLVVLYGLMQLHDRITSIGGRWEWIDWATGADFASRTIWSTFANPNHLAGFLAMLLPLGAALAWLTPQRRTRAAIGVLALPLTVELLQTGTAGAWIGALLGTAVALAVMAPEISAHRRLLLRSGAAGLALVVLASVVVAPDIGEQVRGAFDLRGASTVSQRFSFWRAAAVMAADDPLTGVGPDAYQLRFSTVQDERFVRFLGPLHTVNGPHNIFFSHLAAGGLPSLAAVVTLVGLAGLMTIGCWRRLRRIEKAARPSHVASAQQARVILAGVAGALAAFVVQASFNVYQVGLYLIFWVLLGFLAVLAREARLPSTARPRSILALPGPTGTTEGGSTDPTNGETGADTPARLSLANHGRVALSAAVVVAGAFLAIQATRPYRAERAFLTGQRLGATARTFSGSNPPRAAANLLAARRQLERATSLSPWQAAYAAALARLDASAAELGSRQRIPVASRLAFLREAESGFERALRIEPGHYSYLSQLGEVLMLISDTDPKDQAVLTKAARVAETASTANPWQGRSWYLLSLVRDRQGDEPAALAAAEHGLRLTPGSRDLLEQAAALRQLLADSENAQPGPAAPPKALTKRP